MRAMIWVQLPDSSVVKDPPANAGDLGSILASERFPGKGNGNPLNLLAWEIPWTEEPGRLWGCKELDMTEVT